MKKIGIIADDLTGANDSGIQLTEKGIETSVFFDLPDATTLPNNSMVIDTDSRSMSEKQAYSATKEAAAFLKNQGFPHIYKKMDSTLRGHIGIELQAVFDVYQPAFVIVAPAFPDLGRTTVNGIHYVNGIQLNESEIAADPRNPVNESFIPHLIENQTGLTAGLLTKEDIQKSQQEFKILLEDFQKMGIHFLVCDAAVQHDLNQIVKTFSTVTSDIIWAGSAGLAEALSEELYITHRKREKPPHSVKQVMVVCGTLSTITQRQVQFAKKQPGITMIEMDTKQIFSHDWEMIRNQYKKGCLDALVKGKDVILSVPSNTTIKKEVLTIGEEKGFTTDNIGVHIANAMGKLVKDITAQHEELTGFILTGGDIAKKTSQYLGGVGFQLIQEVETGIPLAKLIGPKKSFTVITKAGAFGTEESIYHAIKIMKGVDGND